MNNSLLLTGTVCLLLAACNVVNTKTFDNLANIVDIGDDKLEACPDNLPLLENGKQMKALQHSLNRMGINVGVVDGKFGASTRNGIKTFQERNKLTLTGKPTKCILDRVDSVAVGQASNKVAQTASESTFKPSKCIKSDLPKGLVEITDKAYQKLNEELPIDTEPYLEGFCTPESKEALIKLYTVLVIEGAIHSRLMLSEYSNLVEIFKKAGAEFDAPTEIFDRARKSLNDDMKAAGNDRSEGIEALGGNFFPDLLDFFQGNRKSIPPALKQTEEQYRKEAQIVIGAALQHSISATFYLTRSTLTAKALTDYLGVKTTEGKSISDNIGSIWDGITKSFQLGELILSHEEEIINMLKASAYSIITLTEDIEYAPPIGAEESNRKVANLKKKRGFTVKEHEKEILRENNPNQMDNKLLSDKNGSLVLLNM